jgi:hypothetical protein
MRMLWTLDELLATSTNGWSCGDCGRLWMDAAPGGSLALPVFGGSGECRHPELMRALVAPPRHGKTEMVAEAIANIAGVNYAR